MEWVSVKERHAPPMETVILFGEGKVLPGWNEATQHEEDAAYCSWEWDFSSETVTHWMPFPEPPLGAITRVF